ncbi:MAG: hypothetical protein DME76_17125 [Verrucomicrobia bacterium]|nr:MAG: hypothetical protein DME76_17125 [Verrucomicrobiota bacterium]
MNYTCPLKRVRLQWKIRPIKMQHVEQNVGKNKNGADEVSRPARKWSNDRIENGAASDHKSIAV